MPRYRFAGHVETVLHGLIHGVNATLHRDRHGQPPGSTLVAQPGDEITTKAPYPHALMDEFGEPAPPKTMPPKTTKPDVAPETVTPEGK